ncbi:MAG TPA: sigma-70 family RNA polymerase sigma factor [Gemmataceae bacterium]|nr:sigma-70 family RNA polymerase sigma factor [Gemmataceae bacterium]
MSSSSGVRQPARDVGEWIAAARSGSREALGHLLEWCRPYLLLVANQQLVPDLHGKVGASDLVQDTFVEAQRDFGRFHGASEDELLAWLRCILLNNVANVSRQYCETEKRQIKREIPLDEAPLGELLNALIDKGQSPSSQVLAQERDEVLRQALARLPEQYRLVIRWRSYERCSFEEVGRRMDRSTEAARKLWARAIEHLEQTLEPPDESA